MNQARNVRRALALPQWSRTVLVAAVLLAGASAVEAQQPATQTRSDSAASAFAKMMRSMMDEQTARLGAVVAVTTAARAEALAKPETAQNLATFIRNLYDALIAKGFSKDDAMRIVSSFAATATSSSGS